jgi:hypothetical protein
MASVGLMSRSSRARRGRQGDYVDQSTRANHNELWKQVDANTVSVTVEGNASMRGPLYCRPRSLAVWQWFWVDGRETSSEFLAKLYQAFGIADAAIR